MKSSRHKALKKTCNNSTDDTTEILKTIKNQSYNNLVIIFGL